MEESTLLLLSFNKESLYPVRKTNGIVPQAKSQFLALLWEPLCWPWECFVIGGKVGIKQSWGDCWFILEIKYFH